MKGDVKGEVGSWKLKEQRAKSKEQRAKKGVVRGVHELIYDPIYS